MMLLNTWVRVHTTVFYPLRTLEVLSKKLIWLIKITSQFYLFDKLKIRVLFLLIFESQELLLGALMEYFLELTCAFQNLKD